MAHVSQIVHSAVCKWERLACHANLHVSVVKLPSTTARVALLATCSSLLITRALTNVHQASSSQAVLALHVTQQYAGHVSTLQPHALHATQHQARRTFPEPRVLQPQRVPLVLTRMSALNAVKHASAPASHVPVSRTKGARHDVHVDVDDEQLAHGDVQFTQICPMTVVPAGQSCTHCVP